MIRILGTYRGKVFFYDPKKKQHFERRMTAAGTFMYNNFMYSTRPEKTKEEEKEQIKLF
jgi:hypothetical protein